KFQLNYFLAGAFLAGAFLAGAFLAGAFLAGAFLAGAFLAGAFLAGAFSVESVVGLAFTLFALEDLLSFFLANSRSRLRLR
ncbi:MAG: hypothetical protein VX407_01165, partial [Verrucomicrobiota bacterium]|nr:hypothetical protein [Verrucomicrobiota bacterium]